MARTVDILIQAGHEGRRRNSGGSLTKTTSSVGTAGEIDLTPKVADVAQRRLAEHGFNVARIGGVYPDKFNCQLAVSIHFDGSSRKCASGASMGYPDPSAPPSNKVTADLWREIYGGVWPFKWMPDNFTSGLRGYYGYAFTSTSVAEILLEMGELSCPDQKAWLLPRVENGYLGELVAYFAARAVGKPIPFPQEGPALGRRIKELEAANMKLGVEVAAKDEVIKGALGHVLNAERVLKS